MTRSTLCWKSATPHPNQGLGPLIVNAPNLSYQPSNSALIPCLAMVVPSKTLIKNRTVDLIKRWAWAQAWAGTARWLVIPAAMSVGSFSCRTLDTVPEIFPGNLRSVEPDKIGEPRTFQADPGQNCEDILSMGPMNPPLAQRKLVSKHGEVSQGRPESLTPRGFVCVFS